ncbi:MAG: ABC transporter ATP-binding protein [Oscillospiraceae bacterium]|nr:ABC transporter ATP-binding protein [Oscillospiraceae bacterium]
MQNGKNSQNGNKTNSPDAVNDGIILEMRETKVHFKMDAGLLKAVDGVSLVLRKGGTLGIVGESGCGKSVTASAIFRTLPSYAKITGDILLYEKNGQRLDQPINITKLNPVGPEIRSIRGGNIAMVFQEPMKAFSPIHTIGNQIIEAIRLHVESDERKARRIAIDALGLVGISSPEQRIDEYPHQLSGGMRQRAMIAMALSCKPAILIADEPTTALDVTVQAQVLDLINKLKTEINTSVIYITHDLGVIAETSDDVAVMYLGKVVEYCDVDSLFHNPRHPYTRALLRSIPTADKQRKGRFDSIRGTVPYPMNLPERCGFYDRCDLAEAGLCDKTAAPMVEAAPGHLVRCFKVESYMAKEVV